MVTLLSCLLFLRMFTQNQCKIDMTVEIFCFGRTLQSFCFAEEGEYHGDRSLMSFEVGKQALDYALGRGMSKSILTTFGVGYAPDSWDDMMESSMTIIYLLAIFASLLSVIVLYNLGLLSFTEIKREFATLKVLGFQLSDLRKLFITQYLGISIVGFIIGVPTGYYVLEAIRSNTDKLYYPTDYSLTTIAISFVITIIVSAIVNLLLANQLKNIDMVEALKKERE